MSYQEEHHLPPHQAWKLLQNVEIPTPKEIFHISGCETCLKRMVIGLGCRSFGSYLLALGAAPETPAAVLEGAQQQEPEFATVSY